MTRGAPVASLPMYDWPEVQWAHDALWAAIRDRLRASGVDAPEALDRERPSEEIWRDPHLLLSQTCGFPFATRLIDTVRLVATPIYAVAGCEGPLYRSAIIARHEDAGLGLAGLARRRIAYNASDSLSGFVALRAALRDAGLDPGSGEWTETGSHRASIRAVAEGRADLASVDAACWALAGEHEIEAARLAIIAWTPARPGLPLVTSKENEDKLAAIRSALDAALTNSDTEGARAALHIKSYAVLGASDYAPIAKLAN